jgi:hypothetical protein
VALAVSAVLVLPLALKHPRRHFTVQAHVIGDILVWLALATLIRLVIFAADWLRTRGSN